MRCTRAVNQIEDLDGSASDRMSLTAYALLKTPHCDVFRAFGAPAPLRGIIVLKENRED